MSRGVLDGVRVLDCTHILSGPLCSMMLADAGAEVIKIERPGSGDPTRGMGPFARDKAGRSSGGYFMRINRGKQSVCVNLRDSRGADIFRRLAAHCDVVVENFVPGTMTRFGLDYEALKKVKPDIIYASITGFGSYDTYPGPYDDRPALNEIAQAMGGIMDITGQKGGPPIDVGAPIGDIFPGALTAFGIVSALWHRQVTGQGQRVDVSMFDSMVFLNERSMLQYSLAGTVPTRGKAGTVSFGGVYKARDGYLAVRVMGDHMWKGFCRVLGLPGLETDARFVTDLQRSEHGEELRQVLESWLAGHDKADATARLTEAGIAAGPVLDAKEVFEHPILRSRGMLVDVEDPVAGVVTTANSPVKFSTATVDKPYKLPRLGEHTRAVLTGLLMMTPADVDQLCAEGVVQAE